MLFTVSALRSVAVTTPLITTMEGHRERNKDARFAHGALASIAAALLSEIIIPNLTFLPFKTKEAAPF